MIGVREHLRRWLVGTSRKPKVGLTNGALVPGSGHGKLRNNACSQLIPAPNGLIVHLSRRHVVGEVVLLKKG